jgi:hypothetical protein
LSSVALVAFKLQASASPDVGKTSLSKTSEETEETEEVLEPPEQAASNVQVISARANRVMFNYFCPPYRLLLYHSKVIK